MMHFFPSNEQSKNTLLILSGVQPSSPYVDRQIVTAGKVEPISSLTLI